MIRRQRPLAKPDMKSQLVLWRDPTSIKQQYIWGLEPFFTWRAHVHGRVRAHLRERDFFIANLLVRIHYTIVMIRWTGLAPWEFEFPFPGSFTSTFLVHGRVRAHLNPPGGPVD
jgi:hypothetical protein